MNFAAFKAGLKAHLQSVSAVSNLVGTRIYPMAFPQGGTLPAVTYTVVDTKPGGPWAGLREITVDLVAADDDSDTPDDVADALEAALVTGPNTARTGIGDIGSSGVVVQQCFLADQEARVDMYRAEERLYAVKLRFVFQI